MGGCCGKAEDDASQEGEANERSRLLVDPIRRSTSDPITAESTDNSINYGSAPQKSDEHSALNRILQQTIINVIDVTQMDNQALEQHDYLDRARAYTTRLPTTVQQPRVRLVTMKDVAGVERVLAAPPLAPADYQMMVSGSGRCSGAVRGMNVKPHDLLVVPFNSTPPPPATSDNIT